MRSSASGASATNCYRANAKRGGREKDGFSTFVDLRKDPELKGIPVVMLTGVGEQMGIRFSGKAMSEYLGEEPAAYLEKPVEPDVLRETIHKGLGG